MVTVVELLGSGSSLAVGVGDLEKKTVHLEAGQVRPEDFAFLLWTLDSGLPAVCRVTLDLDQIEMVDSALSNCFTLLHLRGTFEDPDLLSARFSASLLTEHLQWLLQILFEEDSVRH